MTPGFHLNVPADKYHADPCIVPSLSSSLAEVLLRQSPRKAWFSHPKLNPAFTAEEDAKFDIGKAAHAMLLEGVDIIETCDFDDWRKKEAQERRAAARAAGKIPLLRRHRDAVVQMVSAAEAFIQHSEIADRWSDADSEVTAVCEEKGVWLRARLDRITKSRRHIMDYKSTTDATPEAFSRQILRMDYYIQDAFYRRVVRNLGNVAPSFVFVAQSTEPPYECSLHACDQALQEIADAQVQRAIDLWRQCMTTKRWPTHDGRIHHALPTNYMLQEHEMRLLEAA